MNKRATTGSKQSRQCLGAKEREGYFAHVLGNDSTKMARAFMVGSQET